MALTDPIGDMFSRIRNGQMRSLNSVDIPSSNFRQNILKILKEEGYIKDYYIEKTENNKIKLKINTFLKVLVSPSACKREFKATTLIKTTEPEKITFVYWSPKLITSVVDPIIAKISAA